MLELPIETEVQETREMPIETEAQETRVRPQKGFVALLKNPKALTYYLSGTTIVGLGIFGMHYLGMVLFLCVYLL
jgi:hypothetical protein